MTENVLALGLGAFLTSPGFGGLMAAAAAYIAYKGVRLRLEGDKALATQSDLSAKEAAVATDSLGRWWDAFTWLWENQEVIALEARKAAIEALRDSMVHQSQTGILVALTSVLVPNGGDDPNGPKGS